MLRKNAIGGLRLRNDSNILICEDCSLGKYTQSEIPRKAKHSKVGIPDVAYSNVCEQLKEKSKIYALYFVAFVIIAARWTTVYPTKKKTEVFAHFQSFLAYSERSTGKKLKALLSNGGSEYVSREFNTF